MSEVKEKTVQETIQDIIDNLKSNKFKIVYFCPSLNSPSGGISTLIRQAKILKDAGFNVNIIFEPKIDEKASYQASMKAQKRVNIYERFNPTWMDTDFSDIPFIPQLSEQDNQNSSITKITYNDGKSEDKKPFNLLPEDFLILPEGYASLAGSINNNCKKIVFSQSWIYILNSLSSSVSWPSLGLMDCISISDGITEYVKSIFPEVKIKQYNQSVNRKLFNVPDKISAKLPVIGFSCSRGPESQMKTYNIIKNFQRWYPHYKWIKFVELSGLSRQDFSDRLKECSLYLYTDSIAGFGTVVNEIRATAGHIVGYVPFGSRQLINDSNGFWSPNEDVFQLSEILGIAVDKLLNGELDRKEMQESYEKDLLNYTEEQETESVIKIYNEYINERIDELTNLQTK